MARTEQIGEFEVRLFDELPDELKMVDDATIVSRSSDWSEVLRAFDEGRTVLDPLLGVSIRRLEGARAALVNLKNVRPAKVLSAAAGELRYVDCLGGWPNLKGHDVKVAVLDVGCGFRHRCLPRLMSGTNYASMAAELPDCETPSHHGAKCAGVIGARGIPSGKRIGVAPEAQLGFGQLQYESSESRVDLFLMLSWAISVWGAQVVSHSRGVRVNKIAPWSMTVMSHIALRAKHYANALIFSSAGNHNGSLRFPAAADHVIAVGAYIGERRRLFTEHSGVSELASRYYALLGPGSKLQTIGIGDDCDLVKFGQTSAACAFVAGCAALYYEWFMCRGAPFTADEVFAKMVADSELITDASGRSFRGVRFPQ